MTTPPLPDDFVDAYFAGTLSPEEAERVRVYIAAKAGRRGFMAGLSAAVRGDVFGERPSRDASWRELLARIDAEERGMRVPALRGSAGRGTRAEWLSRRTPSGRLSGIQSLRGDAFSEWTLRKGAFSQRTLLGDRSGIRGIFHRKATYIVPGAVTAALSIVAVLVLGNQSAPIVATQPARTYTTAAGQQAAVIFVDGSHALLGPATTLAVTTNPSDAGVDIRVTGEALFTVTPHRDRAFRVHTGNAVARVLGTTFMMRQYDTDKVAHLVVTEGRVSLSGTHGKAVGRAHVLTASMVGTVNDSGEVQVTPNIAADEYTGWTTRQLVFCETPARDAAIELGRAYGVEIRITDSARAAQPISWTVPLAERSLVGVVGTLATLLDAHPVRVGRVITLMPGRVVSHRPLNPHPTSTSESQYGR